MKITFRKSVNNKYVNDSVEIKTLEQLIEYIKNPPFYMRDKIQDFINFSTVDIPYLKLVVESEISIPKDVFRGKKYLAKIFKFKTKNVVGYWISRGWSDEEAMKMVAKTQGTMSESCHRLGKNKDGYKKRFTTNVDYYLNRGMNESEAREALRERQSTFSLKKCIKKYGEIDGQKKFNERQAKWIESLYDRSDDEIKELFKSRMKNKFGVASKTSLKVFQPLIDMLKKENYINDGEYFIGDGNSKEFFLYDKSQKSVKFYDFCIPKYNVIIEYNGEVWHPRDENWTPISGETKTTSECLNRDRKKEDLAKENGFEILYIWDSEPVDSAIKKSFDFVESKINH